MFYVIRTLSTGAQFIVKNQHNASIGFSTKEDAADRASTITRASVHEFGSDAEARMYINPACVAFRNQHNAMKVAA